MAGNESDGVAVFTRHGRTAARLSGSSSKASRKAASCAREFQLAAHAMGPCVAIHAKTRAVVTSPMAHLRLCGGAVGGEVQQWASIGVGPVWVGDANPSAPTKQFVYTNCGTALALNVESEFRRGCTESNRNVTQMAQGCPCGYCELLTGSGAKHGEVRFEGHTQLHQTMFVLSTSFDVFAMMQSWYG